jgi:uncharacterized protein (UPF0248 family)
METLTSTPCLVVKEDVPNLHFPSAQIFRTPTALNELKRKLKRATALGNLHRSKIKIIFEDSEGQKQVETTIWATGEKNIVLKRGTVIPIHRIVDVQLL